MKTAQEWATMIYRAPEGMRPAIKMPLVSINLYKRGRVKVVTEEIEFDAINAAATGENLVDGDIVKVDLRCWILVSGQWHLVEWIIEGAQ